MCYIVQGVLETTFVSGALIKVEDSRRNLRELY